MAGVGPGLGAQPAAARLLYGMGRDNAIPKKFFGALDPRTRTPRNSVLFTGGLALVGSYLLSYQLGAEMMNCGAFIAFIGANLAALTHYSIRGRDPRLLSWLPPVAGSLICLYIWLHLRMPAKILGTAGLAVGVLYGLRKKFEFRGSGTVERTPPRYLQIKTNSPVPGPVFIDRAIARVYNGREPVCLKSA